MPGTLETLQSRGIRVGLISNSHRCLDSFQLHFGLSGLIDVTIASSEHGYLKPHPRIFEAALARMGVGAREAVMVGDSYMHDVAGARRAGLRGILIARGAASVPADDTVEVIRSLTELPTLLSGARVAAAGRT